PAMHVERPPLRFLRPYFLARAVVLSDLAPFDARHQRIAVAQTGGMSRRFHGAFPDYAARAIRLDHFARAVERDQITAARQPFDAGPAAGLADRDRVDFLAGRVQFNHLIVARHVDDVAVAQFLGVVDHAGLLVREDDLVVARDLQNLVVGRDQGIAVGQPLNADGLALRALF